MALLDDLTLGRYRPGESWLHRCDPRLKLAALPCVIVVVFSATSLPRLALLGLFLLCLMGSARVAMRFWWRGVWVLRWLLLLSLLLHLFFSPGRTLFGTSWLSLDGLLRGLLLDSQVVLVILSSSLLTLTTAPRQLAAAFSRLIRPLRKLRFPVDETAALLMMMFHFFPLLRDEARSAIQELRGDGRSLTGGSLTERVDLLQRLIPPLIFRLIDQADRLALGLVEHDPEVEELIHMPDMPTLKIDQLFVFCAAFVVLATVCWLFP